MPPINFKTLHDAKRKYPFLEVVHRTCLHDCAEVRVQEGRSLTNLIARQRVDKSRFLHLVADDGGGVPGGVVILSEGERLRDAFRGVGKYTHAIVTERKVRSGRRGLVPVATVRIFALD